MVKEYQELAEVEHKDVVLEEALEQETVLQNLHLQLLNKVSQVDLLVHKHHRTAVVAVAVQVKQVNKFKNLSLTATVVEMVAVEEHLL